MNTRVIKTLEWFIGQFQGDSGIGESHWEKEPEYREAKALLDELRNEERATRYDEIRNDLKAVHDHERSCTIRVAKATNEDLDAIGILLRMLNDVSDGQFPPGVDGKHIDRDPVWLDLDDEGQCMTVMKRIFDLLDQNPDALTRVYSAAHLTLTNGVFDPKEDHLTWHPDLVPAVLDREKKGRKGKKSDV